MSENTRKSACGGIWGGGGYVPRLKISKTGTPIPRKLFVDMRSHRPLWRGRQAEERFQHRWGIMFGDAKGWNRIYFNPFLRSCISRFAQTTFVHALVGDPDEWAHHHGPFDWSS